MNRKKLDKLRKDLSGLRGSPQKARALEQFAKQLGRVQTNRGKEPVWESKFDNLSAVSIPHHSNRDIPLGTKRSILNQLEEDLDEWDEQLLLGDE